MKLEGPFVLQSPQRAFEAGRRGAVQVPPEAPVGSPAARVPTHPGQAADQAPRRPGGRVALVRAEIGRRELPDGLAALGWSVEVVPAYRTVPVAASDRDLAQEALWLGLSSGEARAVSSAIARG